MDYNHVPLAFVGAHGEQARLDNLSIRVRFLESGVVFDAVNAALLDKAISQALTNSSYDSLAAYLKGMNQPLPTIITPAVLVSALHTVDEQVYLDPKLQANQITQAKAAGLIPDPSKPVVVPIPIPAPVTETKYYADGSSATGPAPLPDKSPSGSPAVPAPAGQVQGVAFVQEPITT